MKKLPYKLISSVVLGLSIVGCATDSTPKIVATPFGESTQYCASRLQQLNDNYASFTSAYNLYKDKNSVAPWMSPDYRKQDSDFTDYLNRSIKPFVHSDLGIPNAMMNNEVCGRVFDYAQNEVKIDSIYLEKAYNISEQSGKIYDKYFEDKAMDDHPLTASTLAYTNFSEKITNLQEQTKVDIRENRVEYMNFVNNLQK